MKKTEFRFKLLRIRQKISFMAYSKLMTIPELIVSTILRVFRNLEKAGMVYGNEKHCYERMNQEYALWKELLNPWLINTLIMAIQ